MATLFLVCCHTLHLWKRMGCKKYLKWRFNFHVWPFHFTSANKHFSLWLQQKHSCWYYCASCLCPSEPAPTVTQLQHRHRFQISPVIFWNVRKALSSDWTGNTKEDWGVNHVHVCLQQWDNLGIMIWQQYWMPQSQSAIHLSNAEYTEPDVCSFAKVETFLP